MKDKILKILKESGEKFVSGQELSNVLGVSRTSIWKCIKQLKEDGYEIESITRRGYRILSSPDKLSYQEVMEYLDSSIIGREVNYRETISSTNDEMKSIAEEKAEGFTIISEEQTSGKGRLGRNWISQSGKGIYMSILLKPDIEPQGATKITQISAAAVTETLNNLGIGAEIKWPNDIILNGKKIGGILTEMSGELMKIDYVVVGIGININNDMGDIPEDIRAKASSIKAELGKSFDRKEILARILNKFEDLYFDFLKRNTIEKSLDVCREYSVVLDKEIKIISKKGEFIRKAVDISEDGELIVEDSDGNRETLFSGEISVRGLNGYI